MNKKIIFKPRRYGKTALWQRARKCKDAKDPQKCFDEELFKTLSDRDKKLLKNFYEENVR